MQDPNRSDTAARRASKEIATTVWQHAAKIDDRPTTELGLRPHRQLMISIESGNAAFFTILPYTKELDGMKKIRQCFAAMPALKQRKRSAVALLAVPVRAILCGSCFTGI